MEDDNIYSHVNGYINFLKSEKLGSNKRLYSFYEVAVYIETDLESDPHTRFDKGIDHICQQLERSPDDINVTKDIMIKKIVRTI